MLHVKSFTCVSRHCRVQTRLWHRPSRGLFHLRKCNASSASSIFLLPIGPHKNPRVVIDSREVAQNQSWASSTPRGQVIFSMKSNWMSKPWSQFLKWTPLLWKDLAHNKPHMAQLGKVSVLRSHTHDGQLGVVAPDALSLGVAATLFRNGGHNILKYTFPIFQRRACEGHIMVIMNQPSFLNNPLN